MSTLKDVQKDLRALSDPVKKAFFPRFFKTGKGDYGEGDVFLGVTVPQTRSVAKKHRDLPLADIQKLLQDPIHEFRLLGLIILVNQFGRGDEKLRKTIFKFYLDNVKAVNNWDLVDSSAPYIVGASLDPANSSLLDRLAKKTNMWEQRIAIVATQHFIRNNEFEPTIRISKMLLHHPHDLIHKAVGWMLREMGKRDEKPLVQFLNEHAKEMPRTMLRYAIEKFPEAKRKAYMRAKIAG